MASASFATGAVITSTPRSAWTAQGKTTEVNSPSGTTTLARSGNAVATRPNCSETAAPMATSLEGTLTRRAKHSREAVTDDSHVSKLVRPTRQSASAASMASVPARWGGRSWPC